MTSSPTLPRGGLTTTRRRRRSPGGDSPGQGVPAAGGAVGDQLPNLLGELRVLLLEAVELESEEREQGERRRGNDRCRAVTGAHDCQLAEDVARPDGTHPCVVDEHVRGAGLDD